MKDLRPCGVGRVAVRGWLILGSAVICRVGQEIGIGSEHATGEERLTAMLELERTWPDEDFPAVSHDLHAVIAGLAGNQTLALLQSILMQLSAERLYSGNRARVSESAAATRHAHQAIVTAMIARDTTLALRRMRKHLAALAHSTDARPALRRR